MIRTPTRAGLSTLGRHYVAIRDAVGTPFYAYDRATIRTAMDWIETAAAGADLLSSARFCLAAFALPNFHLLLDVTADRPAFGINCNAPEEVLALCRLGWKEWNRVVFSGGVLPEPDLVQVAKTGCLVNVASRGNLDILLHADISPRIGLRVDFSGIALKGIRLEELDECMARARAMGRPVRSLHAYPGTEVEDLSLLIRHAEVLISLAAQHPELEEINFGGGFWFNYSSMTGDVTSVSDMASYFQAVRAALAAEMRGRPITLTWEPGRAIFAASGFFVAEVLETRENSPNTADVYVNASFTNVPVLKIRNRQHHVVAFDRDGEQKSGVRYESRVCGCTTLSSDTLLPRPCPLPPMESGDAVVILDVGAYGRAGSYNYLSKRNPPEILMQENTWRLIRSRQRADHLLEGLDAHE